MNNKTEEYFTNFKKEVDKVYLMANEARSKGYDPLDEVEIPIAMNMAEKVVGLISTIYPQMLNSGIAERITELEKEYGKLDATVVFKIADEISDQKFCKFNNLLESIDAGIRVGFAYQTLGVVSSPIEGYTGIELGKTRRGEDYIIANFSGPIRSAGTTASSVVLILIDVLREKFGFAKYDPTEEEIRRVWTELYDFHDRITNLQYMPTEEEAIFIARNMPFQVGGDPSEKIEVSNYKNLPRVPTNFLRSGFCLVLAEGLAQKAAKGFRLYNMARKNGVKGTGFDWLKEYIELHEKSSLGKGKTQGPPTYIKDLVAGRPIYGHPSRSGGFRFRYGRGRNSGFSAASVHPATMGISDNFLATGTQLKIEKPTKGCAITVCDEIDGPIVKLKNGSVKKLDSKEEATKLYKDVEEIIYLGDLLFPFSDVVNRNSMLIKPGYVEEWWKLDLREKDSDLVPLGIPQIEEGRGKKTINHKNISFEQAIEISKKYKIPLYPKFIYYWTEISKEEFLGLIDWLKVSLVDEKLILPWNKKDKEKFMLGKRALELLGVPHEVIIEHVVLNKEDSKSFLLNLGIDLEIFKRRGKTFLKDFVDKERYNLDKNILQIINENSKFEIKDKAGDFIGARMGRPEKAKLRKLTGSPNALFPVGNEGGRLRSVQTAYEVGSVKSQLPIFLCRTCQKESMYRRCEICDEKTEKQYYFFDVKQKAFENKIENSGREGVPYMYQTINMKEYLDSARKKLGISRDELPSLVKGIRGFSSEEKIPEHLAKGILRAKYNLQVNKDGTIRMDGTELPLVSFKPFEIKTSVEKLKELGYSQDIYGNVLERDDQIIELMPHDILIPSSSETPDEKGEDVFIKICNFVDDLLVNLYGLEPFYNVKKKEDLIGKLGVFMAPHNCAGVACRFIGFSNTLSLMASPYLHAAVRRDCFDYDTNFIFSDNNFLKSEKIGEYVESLIKKGSKIKKIDSSGTIRVDLDKELYAFGTNPLTKKLIKKKIKYFIKGKSPKKWVRIKTCGGREQTMTAEHVFCSIDKNNKYVGKKAKDIKIGERIALLKNFKVSGKINSLFLPKLLSEKVPIENQKDIRVVNAKGFFKKIIKNFGEKKIRKLLNTSFKNLNDWCVCVPLGDVRKLVDENLTCWEDLPKNSKLRSIFNNKEWDFNLKINKSLVNVLGYYAAEGYSRKTKSVSQVCFRIMEKNQRKDLVSSIEDAFGIKPSLGELKTKISICNKLVYYLFKYCFEAGSNAYEKKVPNILYNVSDDLVKVYLSSYFAGDGTILNSSRKVVCFYSVSKKLLEGISLLGCRFGLFGRFSKTKERLPGKLVLERYKQLGKKPKTHILHHLSYSGRDFYKSAKILKPIHKKKSELINSIVFREARNRKVKNGNNLVELEKEGDVVFDFIKEVKFLENKKNSYCLEVDWKKEADKNILFGEQIINFRCDGDEAALMLLGDVLINFSRKFLPSHRGGTQDAPLVMNAKIDAGEVDDQILDFEFLWEYPHELYKLAEQRKHSSEVKFHSVKDILKKSGNPFIGSGFTHDTSDFNVGVVCSAYKTLENMSDKVRKQMELVSKLRAVDTKDTARLVIERHFIRDMRGNLRKFSQQNFRCVGCNEIVRRPPLNGKCPICKGKLIFTINEGGIKKYLEPAIELGKTYNVSPYLQQTLSLVKEYIDSIFGKELEKQEKLEEWF